MNIPIITVPNADAPDLIAALEQRWKADAVRLTTTAGLEYDTLTPAQKVRAMTIAIYRVHTKNYRRVVAEEAIAVVEPDVE